MYIKLSSISLKIKAVMLLLCLGFTMVKSCPGQKFLSNSSSLSQSEQLSSFISGENKPLTCFNSRENIKTPLVHHINRSNNNLLFFVLISSLVFLIRSCLVNKCNQILKNREILVSPVPLFLRNQVFRI